LVSQLGFRHYKLYDTDLEETQEQLLEQLMKTRRTKLLQAHAIMIRLRETLLYAEGETPSRTRRRPTRQRSSRVTHSKGWIQSACSPYSPRYGWREHIDWLRGGD
jgi:hypothetical protein